MYQFGFKYNYGDKNDPRCTTFALSFKNPKRQITGTESNRVLCVLFIITLQANHLMVIVCVNWQSFLHDTVI